VRKASSAWRASLVILTAALLAAAPAGAEEPEVFFFGEAELEGTAFADEPAFAGQKRHDVSAAAKPTLLVEWAGGDRAFRFTPFVRVDEADDNRTHADIRELKLDLRGDAWTATIGVDTVFWGKTEAVHLVDIVNQTDFVEDVDGEAKLGQPMLRLSYLAESGEYSVFALPYFRERTFPGVSGRLRPNPAVAEAAPAYETSLEEWTPSFAFRYAGVFDAFDVGLSAFWGLSREPTFFFDGRDVRPLYEEIGQVGLDLQYTAEATLWKAEAIGRTGQKNARFREEDFVAATGGLEHTLFGAVGENGDLGLILEYAVDSRFDDAPGLFQNDVILGVRLALNDVEDTNLLLTSAIDAETAETVFRLEASRRLSDNFKLSLEGQAAIDSNDNSLVSQLERDAYLRATLTYYFGG